MVSHPKRGLERACGRWKDQLNFTLKTTDMKMQLNLRLKEKYGNGNLWGVVSHSLTCVRLASEVAHPFHCHTCFFATLQVS